MQEFTLYDVVSDRILDPETGWRDRLPSEVITLTDDQKAQFLSSMGKGARTATKEALSRYIDNPRNYPAVTKRLGSYMERLTFHPEYGFMQVAGQDQPSERQWVRSTIKSLV
jgi:hypothetical protein